MKPEIKIEILSQTESETLRKKFSERFLLTWKEYKTANNEWIKLITSKNYSLSGNMICAFERFAIFKETSFQSVLNRLKNKDENVFFMSEAVDFPECKGVVVDGVEHKGNVFSAKASALALLLEHEWNEYLKNEDAFLILPTSLYIFDTAFKKAMALSEDMEYIEIETENGLEERETRLCFSAKSRPLKNKI